MHCWKTINIKHEYGTTRLILWAVITFTLVFSAAYIIFGYLDPLLYTDDYIWLFFLIFISLYPIHKLVHYLGLFKYRKTVHLKFKIDYLFIPIINLRLKEMVPKNQYIFVLLLPFLLINLIIIFVAYSLPQYTHYASILLAYHCSMCLIDMLYIKNLIIAPKDSIIEETPKGYEILIPPNTDNL